MTAEETLKRIRDRWLQQTDPIARNIELATVATKLHPDFIEVTPARVFPHSNWKAAQHYLLDTSAANMMRLTGLLMIAAIGVSIWLCFFTTLSWYASAGASVLVFILTLKLQHSMSRKAILIGVTENAFVFTKLWELKAFALRVNGKVYEPTGNENTWQDVVFFALGLDDLISSQPMSREEVTEDILSKLEAGKKH